MNTKDGKRIDPADFYAAPVADRAFLERVLASMEGVIDVADRATDEFYALRSCVVDLTVMLHTPPTQPAPVQEPVAWMHVMDNTEGIKANGKGVVSITQKRKHPFGKPGVDFSKSYPVTSTPLYTTPPAAQPAVPQADEAAFYYLQDTRGYVGNCPLWWGLNSSGYTTDLRKAQKYTLEEAMSQHRSRDSDLPWLCSEIDAIQRPTIDAQDMHKIRNSAEQRAAMLTAAPEKGQP